MDNVLLSLSISVVSEEHVVKLDLNDCHFPTGTPEITRPSIPYTSSVSQMILYAENKFNKYLIN